MYPEICKIGPFTVYSYGLMMVAAFITASLLACRQAKKQNIDPDKIFNLLFTVFIFGIIGGRIFYIINNLSYYIKNPLEMIMLQKGGLVWYGGLTLGIISGLIFLRKEKLSVYPVLDVVTPFVALGQSIGRIGCLLNGCCFGRESIYGIYFPVHHAVLIPTQAYSSLLLILIFIILRIMQERPHKKGEIFFLYLLLYSGMRFFIEFFRADSPTIFGGLTIFQLISIIIFLLSLIMFAVVRNVNPSHK